MTARAPAAARPEALQRTNSRVLGAVLLAFGSGWLLQQIGVVDLPWTAIVSLALLTLGLGLVMTNRTRAGTVPMVLLGAALTAGLAIGTSGVDVQGGVGERVATPTQITAAGPDYRLAVGELKIDLTELQLPEGSVPAHISANVGVGHLLVRVPAGVAVRADVDARLGSAVVFGRTLDVHGRARDRYVDPGFDNAAKRVTLDLHVGLGQIEVVRVGP